MGKFFVSFTAIVGTLIGAGFLGIPYVIMKSGFLIGIIHLMLLGAVIALVSLYLGEITLRTPGNHQLSGYAGIYLGKKGKALMLFSAAFGIYSALLAYLIGESESLSFLFSGTLNFRLYFAFAFWALLSLISFFGIRALEKGDFLGVSAVFIIIILLLILFLPKISLDNLNYINLNNFFAPFGVILFAYLAFSIIPEIKNILGSEKRKVRPVIIFAYSFAFILYVVFSGIVLGYKGLGTPEIATLSLGWPFILLGMATMFTSYLSLSIALMDSFRLDFKISRLLSWFLVISIPIILYIIAYLTGAVSFTSIISIGGIISGGLAAILILAMVKTAKIKGRINPEYSLPLPKTLKIILWLVFIFGAAFEIYNLLQ